MIAETSFRYPLASPASILPRRLQTSSQHLPWPTHVVGNGNMAAIPQTLHLTKAAKKQQRSGGGKSTDIGTYFGMAEMDQPARYNSKLMNSIWGRYNENSVHNFKSLQCGEMAAAGAHSAQEVLGQAQLQPPSPSLSSSNAMKRRLRELGEAVSANFMDNLNQY